MTELPEIPDEVRGWIGRTMIEEASEFPVEQGYIWTACASAEYGNPLFWDEKLSREIAGAPIAPPTMLSVWMRHHHWAPEREAPLMPLELHFMLKRALELPEAIITKNGLTFGAPVKVGDRLRSGQKLRSISEPKRNKLGLGRYWIIDVEYFDQDDVFLGSDWYNCFGYVRQEA